MATLVYGAAITQLELQIHYRLLQIRFFCCDTRQWVSSLCVVIENWLLVKTTVILTNFGNVWLEVVAKVWAIAYIITFLIY